MARHPNAEIAKPPITGPRPAPTPMTELCRPKARPRSEGGTTSRSMACTLGDNAAAHAACRARRPTSTPNDGATTAPSEQMPKPLTAIVANRRAPNASPTRPARGCPTSIATR